MMLINSSARNTLKIFQPFFPIGIPVGVASLMAVAMEKGINAEFVDEQIEDEKTVMKRIENYVNNAKPPYIFCFSVLTAAFENSLKLSKKLKEKYPDSIVLFGGIHPSGSPDEVLSYDQVDLVLRGEGDNILQELYYRLKNGKDFTDLEGLSYKKDGKIIHNPGLSFIRDMDGLPRFPYHLFADNKKYHLGFVVSSRGCPHKCTFCSNRIITGMVFRYRSAENICNDLELLHDKYNQKDVFFLDDEFLTNKERIYKLVDEIKRRGLHEKMSFGFQARADSADESILKALYSAGFRSAFFGIETASNRIMKLIKKHETVEQITAAIKTAKSIGFNVSGTFIYAFPTETHQDRMDCIKLAKEMDLDQVRFNNATPYPGTELYQTAKSENRLNIQGLYENYNAVLTFSENPFKKIPFTYVPEGSTEKEIRNDLLFSAFSILFTYDKIKKILIRPDLGPRWFKVDAKKIPALMLLFFYLTVKYSELFLSVLLQRNTSISRREFLSIFKDFFKNGDVNHLEKQKILLKDTLPS